MTTAIANSPSAPRIRTIAYWVATIFVAGTSAIAGPMDILRREPFFGDLLHLGYPPYFGTLLGVWKVLGVFALLIPRYPRLREWAYAGFFIEFSAAFVSHVAVDDGFTKLVGPIFSLAFLVASWMLRPASRRTLQAEL